MNGEIREAAWIIFFAVLVLGVTSMIAGRYQPMQNGLYVVDTMTGEVYNALGRNAKDIANNKP